MSARTTARAPASRLVLGTVQLGIPYGRNRSLEVMSRSSAFRILDAAWEMGVRAFDTAEAYGSSASRLRSWIDSRHKAADIEVITKCAADFASAPTEQIVAGAEAAVKRFAGIRRVILLSHGAFAADGWDIFSAAAERHNAAAGQSVYTPGEVESACEIPGIVKVQAPGNVLDDRAIKARGTSSVSLDLRSIFLQGVLLESPAAADARAPGAFSVAARLQATARKVDADLAQLLIAGMIRSIGDADRLVLGVDDHSQLNAFPAAMALPGSTVSQFCDEIATLREDPAVLRILDPRLWDSQPASTGART